MTSKKQQIRNVKTLGIAKEGDAVPIFHRNRTASFVNS